MGKIQVLSRSEEAFADRREAGRLLGAALERFRAQRPVVLGIPRGGVVVAAEVADHLGAELDIVLSRKIGAPGNPELAIGAIAEDGHPFLDDAIAARLGVSRGYIEREERHQLGEIARRVEVFRKVRPRIPLAGRVVIVVDDGLATGATMQAALWAVRRDRPGSAIVAVPVAAEDTIERIAKSADELLCLRAPWDFGAVGRFYDRFDQVEDDEVLAILERHRAAKGVGA
ncbi:MAG TPA: phosphoribosyltransferase family protein [bacterium]